MNPFVKMAEKAREVKAREAVDESERQANAALTEEIDALRKAAPLCEKHKPNGGCRSVCVICSGEKLQGALSRIDYALGEPNEMGVSEYDVFYDEDAVVRKVEELVAGKVQERLTDDAILDLWSLPVKLGPRRPVLGRERILAFARAVIAAAGVKEAASSTRRARACREA